MLSIINPLLVMLTLLMIISFYRLKDPHRMGKYTDLATPEVKNHKCRLVHHEDPYTKLGNLFNDKDMKKV